MLLTPSENEVRIGDWVVRNPISKGTFGHVSIVTHASTGKPAAVKELWQTPRNSRSVEREVAMARQLLNVKHVCFLLPMAE